MGVHLQRAVAAPANKGKRRTEPESVSRKKIPSSSPHCLLCFSWEWRKDTEDWSPRGCSVARPHGDAGSLRDDDFWLDIEVNPFYTDTQSKFWYICLELNQDGVSAVLEDKHDKQECLTIQTSQCLHWDLGRSKLWHNFSLDLVVCIHWPSHLAVPGTTLAGSSAALESTFLCVSLLVFPVGGVLGHLLPHHPVHSECAVTDALQWNRLFRASLGTNCHLPHHVCGRDASEAKYSWDHSPPFL